MERMIRKQVYLEPEQDQRVKQTAVSTGKSEAQVIRESLVAGLEATLEEAERIARWNEVMEAMRERVPTAHGDGPAGERTWTREDLYDRYERSKMSQLHEQA